MAEHWDSTEDTDARWEPIPDDVWSVEDSGFGDERAAGSAGRAESDEWLEPARTMVRPRPVEMGPQPAARSYGEDPWPDDAGGAYEPRESRVSRGRAWSGGPSSRQPRVSRVRAERAPRGARHGCLSFLLWLVMLAVVVVMALRCLPADLANGRLVPEAVSFVPWLFAPIVLCLVLALLWRRRLLAVVAAAALAAMLWWHAGFLLPREGVSDAAVATAQASADPSDGVARVMTLNTAHGAASAEEVVALVREKNVEVLCLQELTDDFLSELSSAGLYDLLPYYVISDEASAISNGGRNGIWTLAPMDNVSGNLLPIDTSSMPAGTVQIGGLDVRVVSVHPNSPVRGAQDLWDEGLGVIGSLSEYDHTYLVMGDFNSTWDHARFRELLGTGFVDASSEAGEGFHMTYPSGTLAGIELPSLVEIDHIVYARDSGITVSELETAEVSGTDHRALLGVLEVA